MSLPEDWTDMTLEQACVSFTPPMGPVQVCSDNGKYYVELDKLKIRIPTAGKRHSLWIVKTLFKRNQALQKELDAHRKQLVEHYPRSTDDPWPWAEIGGEG